MQIELRICVNSRQKSLSGVVTSEDNKSRKFVFLIKNFYLLVMPVRHKGLRLPLLTIIVHRQLKKKCFHCVVKIGTPCKTHYIFNI